MRDVEEGIGSRHLGNVFEGESWVGGRRGWSWEWVRGTVAGVCVGSEARSTWFVVGGV